MIAALYTALCFALAPISFGVVQIRVSEALTLLAVFCPEAVIGVTLGCFISNLLMSTIMDSIVGSLATFISGVLTYKLRGARLRSLAIVPSLPPVIINAFAIGIMLTYLYFPATSKLGVWLLNIVSVGAGQFVSCCVLGVLLVFFIERHPSLMKIMKEEK